MNILELAQARFGRRRKITRDEMVALLAEYSRANPGALGNGYVPDTMPEKTPPGCPSDEEWQAILDAQPPSYHDRAARAWAKAVGGITVISVGGGLRDGGTRYDQPGSMHPMQMSDLSFYSDHGRAETISYLRQHCRRLLLVREESELTPPPPTAPSPEHAELHAQWVLAKDMNRMHRAREAALFEETGDDDGIRYTPEEREFILPVRMLLAWEQWPEDPAEVEAALERMRQRPEGSRNA